MNKTISSWKPLAVRRPLAGGYLDFIPGFIGCDYKGGPMGSINVSGAEDLAFSPQGYHCHHIIALSSNCIRQMTVFVTYQIEF